MEEDARHDNNVDDYARLDKNICRRVDIRIDNNRQKKNKHE